MAFTFRIRTFGNIKKDKRINPDRTYLVNLRKKIYDPHSFSNFVDAQNVITIGHDFDRKSFARTIALKGKSIKQAEKTNFKFKKGKII